MIALRVHYTIALQHNQRSIGAAESRRGFSNTPTTPNPKGVGVASTNEKTRAPTKPKPDMWEKTRKWSDGTPRVLESKKVIYIIDLDLLYLPKRQYSGSHDNSR